jgi:hypothetical protein
VAENEKNALIVARAFLVLLRIFGKLFLKDNRRSCLPLRTLPFNASACLNVSQNGEL